MTTEDKIIKCKICGNKSSIDFFLEKNNFNIYRCKNCNVFFVYPIPSAEELKKIYSFENDYFKYTGINHSQFVNSEYFNWYKKEGAGKNFLDVGCGNGQMLFSAEENGFNATGLDLNNDMIKILKRKNFKVFNSTLENFDSKKESYGSIYLGDIIEHVQDPDAFLKKCNFLLKKNGKMIISTPNTNSFFAKYQLFLFYLFKIPWGHISPPYHLFEFSDKNIKLLLEKNHFQIKKIIYKKIPLNYIIGNIGLFNEFKNRYRKNKNFYLSFREIKLKEKILLMTVFALYSVGYCLDKFLFPKKGNEMTLFIVRD